MKYLGFIVIFVLIAGQHAFSGGPARMPELAKEKLAKVEEALPSKAPAEPKSERKVLILWRCDGFFHKVIPLANEALRMLGEKSGAYQSVIPATQAEQMDYLDPERLQEFDAIIFNSTTRLKPNEKQQQAILGFLEAGKGIVGIHAATDNFYEWPEGARIMGGLFSNHPWHEDVRIKIDDPEHKLCTMFDADGFTVKDEIYQFNNGVYNRADQRVLLSLDYEKVGKKGARPDNDYAISWVKRYGNGRVFYCSLGHDDWIFWNTAILKHFLAGIQFALGDLPVDTEPNPLTAAELNPLMGVYEGLYTKAGEQYPAQARVADYGGGEYQVLLTADKPDGFDLQLRNANAASTLALYTDSDKGQKGVNYRYYEGDWDSLPDFGSLKPVKEGVLDSLSLSPRNRDDFFAFVFEGFIAIDKAGRHEFFIASDDGSRLWVDGRKVIDNDGLHAAVRKSAVLELSEGMHEIRLDYFEKSGGEELAAGVARAGSDESKLVLLGNAIGANWKGKLETGMLTAAADDPGKGHFELKRVDASSPKSGLKPPPGALVLLPRGDDGRPSLAQWSNQSWRSLADGSMEVAKGQNQTLRRFGDMRLHLEFCCPYEPAARGQSRGNSGVYIQNRYELQVLDSFGLPPAWNQCGGIYKVAKPLRVAELPPATWQTYDIWFRAPRFDSDGKLQSPALIERAELNGVLIHSNVVIDKPTRGAGGMDQVPEGPLRLQDHAHPVRYRNIWVKPSLN